MPDKNQEISLVIAAKNGDTFAFEALYELYYPKIYALAYITLKNSADAEDILQMSFVKAWQNLDKLENPSAFNTWLQRITLNLCNTTLHKIKSELSVDYENDYGEVMQIESDLELPEQYAEREDLSYRLRMVIDNLSIVQKETILLYYYNEMSVEEIAEIMDCSPGTVKSRLFFARRAIKTEIEEQEQKSGERFYGIVGVPLIPFGWLFVRQIQSVGISPTAAADIFSQISQTLFPVHAGNAGAVNAAGNSSNAARHATAGAVKNVAAANKFSIPLWGKITAVVLGVAIVAGCGSIAWKALKDPGSGATVATEIVAATQAAADATEAVTETPTETPTVTEETQESSSDPEDYITLYQDTDYVHSLGEANSEKIMPLLTIDSPDAKEFNSAMTEKYDKFIDDISYMNPSHGDSYDYEAYMNGRILSISVCRHNALSLWYTVFNINVDTGEALDNDEVLALCGTSLEDVKGKISDTLDSCYRERIGSAEQNGSQYTQTMSDENISKAQFALGENGSLYAVLDWYMEAQSRHGQWYEEIEIN